MRSSNIIYMPRLDHLRGLAAILVFSYHLYHHFYHNWKPNPDAWYMGLIVEGHTGIGLFFVLSGFIFMLIRLNSVEISYWGFMRNRFLRIFPLFLFVFFVAISIGRNDFRAEDILYLFFSNLGLAPTSNSFITGAAWSISIEFTFYMIFPFLALAIINKGTWYIPRLLIIILLFKWGAYFISENPKHMYYSTLLGRIDQFLIGMLAAIIYIGNQKSKILESSWMPILALVLVWAGVGAMAYFFSYQSSLQKSPWWVIWPTVEALLWATLIVSYLASKINIPNFMNTGMEAIGQVSYSLYLLHALILWLWSNTIGPVTGTGHFMSDLALNLVLVGLVSFGFAKLSYHTLEEPFLHLRQRYVKG
jgi:peptidoglycan/LPS O-acetylase OafA/YrhL